MEPISVLKAVMATSKAVSVAGAIEKLGVVDAAEVTPVDLLSQAGSVNILAGNIVHPESLNIIKSTLESKELTLQEPVKLWELNKLFRNVDMQEVDRLIDSSPKIMAKLEKKCHEVMALKPSCSDQDWQKLNQEYKIYCRKHIMPDIWTTKLIEVYRPYFESVVPEYGVSLQGKGFNQNGSRIDLLFRGAKQPIIGKDLYISQGSDLAMECKSGSIGYLRAQVHGGHLEAQVAGHLEVTKHSIVFCDNSIRDVVDEREIRQKIKEMGSSLINVFNTEALIDDVSQAIMDGKYATTI